MSMIDTDTNATAVRRKLNADLRRRARDNWVFTGALKRTPLAHRVRLIEAIDQAVAAERAVRELATEIARLPCNRLPKR